MLNAQQLMQRLVQPSPDGLAIPKECHELQPEKVPLARSLLQTTVDLLKKKFRDDGDNAVPLDLSRKNVASKSLKIFIDAGIYGPDAERTTNHREATKATHYGFVFFVLATKGNCLFASDTSEYMPTFETRFKYMGYLGLKFGATNTVYVETFRVEGIVTTDQKMGELVGMVEVEVAVKTIMVLAAAGAVAIRIHHSFAGSAATAVGNSLATRGRIAPSSPVGMDKMHVEGMTVFLALALLAPLFPQVCVFVLALVGRAWGYLTGKEKTD